MTNPLLDTSSLPRFGDIDPDQVMPALNELLAAHRQTLSHLLEDYDDPCFESLVVPLEAMGHTLSRVWSPISHMQSVKGSPEWRAAYEKALPVLTEYGTELSQNEQLQQAFVRVDEKLGDTADCAQRSMVQQALRDFRLAGVDLEPGAKARFKDIMQELAAVQSRFSNNVQDASDAWSLVITDEGELAGLSEQVIERAGAQASEPGTWKLTLDFPTYHAVLTHAEHRPLREALYKAWSTRASDHGDPAYDNSENIQTILKLRAEKAKIVGFNNYSEYSLARKMADTPEQVIEFLRHLAESCKEAAQREIDELTEQAGGPIAAWDVSYELERLKQNRFAVSNEALRSYFPVDKVIDGLFDLASRLYGLKLSRREDIDTWHDDVLFYDVSDEGGDPIGGFYADLFARSGKRTGAWIDECVCRKRLGGDESLPVGYLVCNFTPRDANGRSFLTHEEIVTLFHEFGHMLHHLLTTIDYPSISGINGVPWDAVELPSQFMENFAWSYDVLERCSEHRETGQRLPRDLFKRLDDSRHAGAALAMLRQIEFALFDFRLHTEFEGDDFDVLALLDEVRDEVAMVSHPEYNRMPHAFAHIFAGGYAAGYYSYKWAEVLAADAFAAFEEAGIFDAQTAARFRTEILEIGGSRDFMEAYVAFRGREPSIDALLRQSGIEAA
ncbi:MAG: M3 family metallopeptidase [Woeseiaceae bacterium]|nr:M3 family metallopeptidase [Woeseiaceae bacterium]